MHLFNKSRKAHFHTKKKSRGRGNLPITEKWASGLIYKNHRILGLCFEEQSEIKARPKSLESTTENHSTSEHYMGFQISLG